MIETMSEEIKTESKQGNGDLAVVIDSFQEHTLKKGEKAKKLLIESGFHEEDFYKADEYDVDFGGYLLGEQMVHSEDEGISAREVWNEKVFWDKHADDYLDYMIENCL